jgi:hypothetical protein
LLLDANVQRQYPQVAVAIGSALPVLDEKSRMEENTWAALQSRGRYRRNR